MTKYTREIFSSSHTCRNFIGSIKIKAKRKSQPFCAVGLLFIVLDTHTHGREREEDDNCLSWEKEKDVEDTAVKIRRTLVLTYTT